MVNGSMTEANIYCHGCKMGYDVYWLGLEKEKVQKCPHCGKEMSKDDWFRIIDAMAAVHDVNCHFHKYHLERDEPLFTVSIKGLFVGKVK